MKTILNLIVIATLFTAISLGAQDFVFDKEKGKAVPNFIGQIKLLKGKVFKKVNSETQEVSIGERFKLNDVVVTQEQSFVKIQMIDDSMIILGPKSEMKLASLEFKDKTDRSMTVELIKGQLGADIKNRAKPGELNFKTKYTTMGVRGTYFLMNHRSQGPLDIAEYAVLEGKVEVLNQEGENTPLVSGERITLIHDSLQKKAAGETLKLSSTDITNLNPKINEETEIKPFLPYLELNEIPGESPLQSVLASGEAAKESAPVQEKSEAPKKNWKDSLKKLNEKLRERQKTR